MSNPTVAYSWATKSMAQQAQLRTCYTVCLREGMDPQGSTNPASANWIKECLQPSNYDYVSCWVVIVAAGLATILLILECN
jgi:hypothetical protein